MELKLLKFAGPRCNMIPIEAPEFEGLITAKPPKSPCIKPATVLRFCGGLLLGAVAFVAGASCAECACPSLHFALTKSFLA